MSEAFKNLANDLSKHFGGTPILETSPSTDLLATALSAFHGDTKSIAKRGKNLHFKSSYAMLGDIEDGVREALAKHGLAYTVAVCPSIGEPIIRDTVDDHGNPKTVIIERIRLRTVAELIHSSGQFRRTYGEFPVPHGSNISQQIRATATYAKGTLITAMLSVSGGEEDDDGESLADPVHHEPVRQSQKKPPPGPSPISAAQRDLIRTMFGKLGVADKDQVRWTTAQGFVVSEVHRDTAKAAAFIEVLKKELALHGELGLNQDIQGGGTP